MVEGGSANGTEIMKVTITAENPYVASNLANCVAEVLMVRISEVIDGATMEVVDFAVPNLDKVAPSITKYTIVAFVIGVLISAAIVVIFDLMDDRFHDEYYILQTYDYPILAKIPDLMEGGGKRYGKSYGRYGYYYQSRHVNGKLGEMNHTPNNPASGNRIETKK